MGTQEHLYSIIYIEPLWMMVQFVSSHGSHPHKGPSSPEILELKLLLHDLSLGLRFDGPIDELQAGTPILNLFSRQLFRPERSEIFKLSGLTDFL